MIRKSVKEVSAKSHLLDIASFVFEKSADLLIQHFRRVNRSKKNLAVVREDPKYDWRQLEHSQLEAIRATVLLSKPFSALEMIAKWGILSGR